MYIGLDFGTSFSQAAAMQLGEPVLLMPGGVYGIPTAFYYDKEVGILLGADAIDEGQGVNSKNLSTRVKLDLTERFSADGREFTAEEMVSSIYRYVADIAHRVAKQKCIDTAETIEGAVLSAPVNFSAYELELLKKACMKPVSEGGAGLPVLAVIKEPVAAAVAYFGTGCTEAENILVFDLGGGTCDIALLHSDRERNIHYTVIDSDMVRLGAKEWDTRIANYLAFELSKQTGCDIAQNPAFYAKVALAAVDVKHSLTEYESKNARVEINGKVYKVTVTRRMMDALTESCRQQVLGLLKQVYDRNADHVKITDIICVGGGSLMPQISEGIRAMFPNLNVHSFCPETAVAYGAAMYARMIAGETSEEQMQIDDISSYSYGIRVFDDYDTDKKHEIISNLIIRGDSLPVSSFRTFKTIKKGDGRIIISVYENTYRREKCEIEEIHGSPIGKVILEMPKGTPAGVKVHVTMKLNTSRMLEVSARDDEGNSVKARFEINADYKRQ